MAYTSNPGSSQEPKSLREFSKSCHPFYPAAPFFQVGFALVLSVVLNFVLFYASYEERKEWKLRASLESTAAFFLPLSLQTKPSN